MLMDDRIAGRVIEAEERNPREAERLQVAVWERLSDVDVYRDLLARLMGEILAQVCDDLELSPRAASP